MRNRTFRSAPAPHGDILARPARRWGLLTGSGLPQDALPCESGINQPDLDARFEARPPWLRNHAASCRGDRFRGRSIGQGLRKSVLSTLETNFLAVMGISRAI